MVMTFMVLEVRFKGKEKYTSNCWEEDWFREL